MRRKFFYHTESVRLAAFAIEAPLCYPSSIRDFLVELGWVELGTRLRIEQPSLFADLPRVQTRSRVVLAPPHCGTGRIPAVLVESSPPLSIVVHRAPPSHACGCGFTLLVRRAVDRFFFRIYHRQQTSSFGVLTTPQCSASTCSHPQICNAEPTMWTSSRLIPPIIVT